MGCNTSKANTLQILPLSNTSNNGISSSITSPPITSTTSVTKPLNSTQQSNNKDDVSKNKNNNIIDNSNPSSITINNKSSTKHNHIHNNELQQRNQSSITTKSELHIPTIVTPILPTTTHTSDENSNSHPPIISTPINISSSISNSNGTDPLIIHPTTTNLTSHRYSANQTTTVPSTKYIREPFFWSTTRFIHDTYEIGMTLGKGQFGVVYQGKHKYTNEIVAIKRIDKEKTKPMYIETEIMLMRECLNHPCIVQLYCVYETPAYVYLVLEYLAGGELFSRLINIGAYSEHDARIPMKNIIEALIFLHDQNIIHRDLKPENLLLTTIPTLTPSSVSNNSNKFRPEDDEELYHVKIADLGLAKRIDPLKKLTAICGTWAYSSPEMRNPTRPGYGPPMDCFALGVIMYIILCGYHPFDPLGSADQATILQAIQSKPVEFTDPVWNNVSDNAKDLIQKLLIKNPWERYTAKQALQHPWIQNTQVSSVPLRTNIGEDLDLYRKRMAQKMKASMLVAMASVHMLKMATGRRWSAPVGSILNTNVLPIHSDISNNNKNGNTGMNVSDSISLKLDIPHISKTSDTQTSNSSRPQDKSTIVILSPTTTIVPASQLSSSISPTTKLKYGGAKGRRHSIIGGTPMGIVANEEEEILSTTRWTQSSLITKPHH